MFEMIILLVAVCGLIIWAVKRQKPANWTYIVDNVSINYCRKFDDLKTAMNMYNLCVEDGHEVYIKRVRG